MWPFKKKAPAKKMQKRRFSGAAITAANRFNASWEDIRAELQQDYGRLTTRARALAKNNETVAGYINLMIRNILGETGFRLNVTCRKDGRPDLAINEEIEREWYLFQKEAVSGCGRLNGWAFDRHILFNLLVDGEVFIRLLPGGKYELIDPMDVDIYYYFPDYGNGIEIIQGVEIDRHGRPLAYYVKERTVGAYGSGERIRLDGEEVIHIFPVNFVRQVRGYTPLAPLLLNLNSLEEYKKAEVNAALLSSCYMGIWEKTGMDAEDAFSDDADDAGNVAEYLESNVFRYAPDGYTLKGIQSNHPNSNLGGFFKACLRGMAACLGISYNKLNADYESVNYSSLRQANVEDCATWKAWQRMLVDEWKEKQFARFLKAYLLGDHTAITFARFREILYGHEFREYLDPEKEYKAISLKLALKLTNPVMEAEKLGLDMADILDGWVLYKSLLKERNLTSLAGEKETLFPIENEQENETEINTITEEEEEQ